MLGLVLGVSIGGYIDDRHFKMTIGLIVLVCILIILYTGRSGAEVKPPLSMRGMAMVASINLIFR
jgi:uncharacterized membrane protein YfcA